MDTFVQRPSLTRRSQLGLSLVEMAIAIAVVAGLVIATVSWVRRIQIDRQLEATRSDAIVTMNAAIANFATLPTTAGANMQRLTAMNVWPRERTLDPGVGAASVQAHFKGGQESLTSNDFALGNLPKNGGFVYWISGVPQRACSPLVTSLATYPQVVAVWAGPWVNSVVPLDGKEPVASNGVRKIKAANGAIDQSELAIACREDKAIRVALAFHKG